MPSRIELRRLLWSYSATESSNFLIWDSRNNYLTHPRTSIYPSITPWVNPGIFIIASCRTLCIPKKMNMLMERMRSWCEDGSLSKKFKHFSQSLSSPRTALQFSLPSFGEWEQADRVVDEFDSINDTSSSLSVSSFSFRSCLLWMHMIPIYGSFELLLWDLNIYLWNNNFCACFYAF